MTDRPPNQRSLAEVLDAIRLHADLEEHEAKAPAERERELGELGYDPAAIRARIAAAREAAYGRPGVAPAPSAAPPAKVVDLGAARAARQVAATRWGLLAAAAAVALLVGGGGVQVASTWMPARTVDYPTEVRPPSPEQRAAPSRKRAFRLCALGYYEECQDVLDEVREIDPEGESSDAVKAARKSILDAYLARDANNAGGLFAKPPVGPKERPLQRRH